MNEQTLELQIQSKAQSALSNVDSLISKLTSLERTVSSIDSKLKTGSVNNANSNVNQLKNTIDKTTSSTDKLGRALKSVFTFTGVKRLTTTLLGWMNEAIDYTEQLNLFNVVFDNVEKNGIQTFSKLGKEATQFQYKLNEAFGTNKTQTLYTQGIFQSMGETVGIDDAHSAIMSETMTKLTYDLASLYNKTETATAEAIRAGVYAGQTKPLRNYGIDVTQMSMQPILDSLGIDKQVKEMSQAEKEILRYLATMKQAQIAMGDLANTIESPSNQLKIFRQQLIEAKVALSSLFIGGLSSILPYANAILMVVKEVSKAIASMFGIKLKDYNSGIASTNKYSDSLGGVGSSADKAGKKVKELKRQVLGFDEIHNIDENKNSGSGSSGSGGTSGGIDRRLLDAIKGYDNGMEKVKMKATQIRDKIMEWLGFHKKINPLTGETSWYYGGISETLKNIWNTFKGLSIEGKVLVGIIGTIVGYKIYSGITKIAKKLLGVDSLVTLSGKNLTTLGKVVKSLKVSGWSATITKVGSKLSKIVPVGLKVVGVVGSLAAVILGSAGAYSGMKELTKGTENATKQMTKFVVGMASATAGGAVLGAMIGGPIGAAVGALTGLVISGASAWFGYNKAMKELAESELFGNLNISVSEWTNLLKEGSPVMSDFSSKHEDLKSKLLGLNDVFLENSEQLDLINYKYSVLGQTISKENLTTIIDSVNGMCEATAKAIDENTDFQLDLWGSFFRERGTLNSEEDKQFLNAIIETGNSQKSELKNTQDNITNTYKNAIDSRGYLTDEEYNYIQEQLNKIKELTQVQMSQANSDIVYWKTKIGSDSLNIDKESYKNLKTALEKYKKEQNEIIATDYNTRLNSLENLHKNGKISESEYNSRLKELNNQRSKDYKNVEDYITSVLNETTDGLKKKYKELADDTSEKAKYQRKAIESIFEDLNIDTSKLETQVRNSASKVNSVFSANLRTDYPLKVGLDTSKLQNDLKNLDSKLGTNYSKPTYGRKANGGIYSNGSWKNIPQYANGGTPSHGTMFVAGEAGAEIVGHINGKTEVLNQSQIASAIYSAVYSAMSQFNGGGIAEINVHASKDVIVETAINGINQQTNQTGICPVKIPVY